MLSIKSQIPDVKKLTNEISKAFNDALKSVVPDITKLLIDYASKNHKFTSRSGNLQNNAIKTSIDYVDGKINISLYLDTAIAPYASFIVSGVRRSKTGVVRNTKGADPFLEKAITDNEAKIISMIEKALSKVK